MSRNRTAHEQGREAAERGHERLSPYIGIRAEGYWYAGFDNAPYIEHAMNDYYDRLREIHKKYEEMDFPGGDQERLERIVEEIKKLDEG